MDIQVISDVHTEMHKDGGAGYSSWLCLTPSDVLVIAGDMGTAHGTLCRVLRSICTSGSFKDVLFVAGNHEYYQSTPLSVNAQLAQLDQEIENFHWLNNDVVEIGGVRFVGTTLWFPDTPNAQLLKRELNDFHCIGGGFETWVYEENERAQRFLNANVREGDIVITHHSPSYRSQRPRFAGTPFSCYFVCDMEELIAERSPELWVHGHMHNVADYQFFNTRVLCNPVGYPHESTGYKPTCVQI